MMHSIRWKFTVIFIALMAFAVAAIWCINNWFLGSYYLNYKIDILENGYHAIDEIVKEEKAKGGSALEGLNEALNGQSDIFSGEDQESPQTGPESGAERLANVVTNLRDRSNITVLIYDSMKAQTMVSSARDYEALQDRVRQYIVGRNAPRREILREYDNYIVQKTFDPRSKTFYLESWGFFSDNGTIFIMTTPLESIRESASISNRFLMWVGLIVILVASVILYVITKRITAPIYRMSQLSERMSNLDFDAKYVKPKRSTEELDTLGSSMNLLSDRLKETIGALQKANQQLQEDIQEKIQIDEMRKEFIANVSHELKTPIALIQGYAEGLNEGMADDKENREFYCEVITDEANKMNKMVKQLLTLTALEFGREQTANERFDLTELIRGILTASGLILEQKKITADFPYQEPLYVRGDEFKMEEVVTNYLMNALNHAEGERRIEIRMERSEDQKEVRVSVFNTGQPIPEEDIPNIWVKFYKVDKARTRSYGGSGIGLSIVKAIMESHHKEYGVRNHEDGVEFWFTLDCDEQQD